MYTTSDLITIHNALHDPKKDFAVISGARALRIKTARNGCRKVDVYHYGTLMEQNIKKSSSYARRAKKGEKLSWFIPAEEGEWRLITDKGEEL